MLDDRPAAYADIPRLGHTQRVFTESLRLYPPAWLYTRTTTEPTELAGRRLPWPEPCAARRQSALTGCVRLAPVAGSKT